MKNFKYLLKGVCLGIIISIVFQFYCHKVNDTQKKNEFIDSFDAPKITNDIKFKKKVIEKKYTIDYYGQKINFQDENLKVYGFDKNGNIYEEKLDSVEVYKFNTDINFENYISDNEYEVYSILKYKDNINTQYKIYELFVKMRKLSEELLNRNNSSDRIEYLYNICLLYIEPDSMYTIGNTKFEDINSSIKKDIKDEVLKLKYIVDNGKVMTETNGEKVSDTFSKILKYNIINMGK